MAAVKKLETLIATKTKLAEKYLHLSHLAGSKPKRATFLQKSNRYRRQVETLVLLQGQQGS